MKCGELMETYGNDSCIPTAIMSQESPESAVTRWKAYQKQWAFENRDRLQAKMKAYYLANREKLKARSKARYEANKPTIAAKKKVYMRGYRQTTRARDRERLKAWRKANPDQYRKEWMLSNAKRQAACIGSNYSGEHLRQKLAYYGHQCIYCGHKGKLEWDHVKPLSKGGANLLCNLAPACRSCNATKHNVWEGVSGWLRCRDYGVTVLRNTPQPAPHSGNAEKI